MSAALPADLAIHSDGEHLILPLHLDPHEIESIVRRKPQLLASLRSSQMDKAGFYIALPGSLYRELQAAPWMAISTQTTASTRFSTPERISSGTFIGSQTWLAYRANHPDALAKTQPRTRVLTIYAEHLRACAWDLDALSPDDRQRLISVVLNNKVVIAHNAGLDLSWLFLETTARPAFVLDTMLLTRQVRPQTLLRPYQLSVSGDLDTQAQCRKLIAQEDGGSSASPEWIAACLKIPVPDKSFQQHTSWGVSILSAQHRQYAASAVKLPMRILKFLFPNIGIDQMQSLIGSKYPWYIPYAASLVRLAEAHGRGIPFDVDAAEKLGAALTESLRQAADDLAQVPEFTRLYDQLLDPDAGETGAQKSALVEYVARNDIALPQTKTGVPCTMKQAGKVEKVSGLPAWKLLHTIQTNKSGLRVVRQYQKAAANDGRVHSLITFEAATGRTVSTAPTVQNIPRDPRFRKLVQAKPGHLILAVDYSAIELVIAAALAERAVDDLRTRVKRGDEEGWFMGQVWAGCCATTRLTCPAEPEPKWTLEWLNEAIPATAQQVLRRKEQAMASIFRRKLDPHLVTAIDMARRTGKIDTGGLNSVEWLAAQDDQATKAIKVQLKQERQSAKPVNFGLLYGRSAIGLHGSGISDYGLTWTIQEATQARNAWFDLYPELRLWHFWTKYTQSRKVETNQCVLWDTYKRKLVRPQHKPYIYEPTTLAGRPFALLDRFKEARNYQDQGTGADILANAIAALPEDVAAMMLMPVHDELVFEAPGNAIEEVKRAVVETMIRAADTVLGGEIPIEVETAIGETWRKA